MSFLTGLGSFGGGFMQGLQAGQNFAQRRQLFNQDQGATSTAGSSLFDGSPDYSQYGTPALGGGLPGNSQVAEYIRTAAQQRGIDPNVAIKVFNAESGLRPNAIGDSGSSFGPTQLHYGGVAGGGNSVPGLGDEFTRTTGLNARDPSTWQKQVDFALDRVRQGGWGPWHAAANIGVQPMQGVGGGAPQGQPAQPQQGGFSPMLQRAIGMINRANPNASPMQKMLALEKMAPFLKQEDQMAVSQMKMEMQNQLAGMRYDMARDLERGRNQRADQAEQGRTDRAAAAEKGKSDRATTSADLAQQRIDAMGEKEKRIAQNAQQRLKDAQDRLEIARQNSIRATTKSEFDIRQKTLAAAQKEVADAERAYTGLINAEANVGRSGLPSKTTAPVLNELEQRRGAARERLMQATDGQDAAKKNEDAPAQASPPIETLKEGQVTRFRNGQAWTLKDGKPERVQ